MLTRIIRQGRARYSMRFAVVCVFVFATGSTAALAIALHWHFSRGMAIDGALTEYHSTALRTAEHLSSIDQSANQTTRLLASYPALVDGQWIAEDTRDLFAKVLRTNPMFYAVYIGFDNGDFYELINLESSRVVRAQIRAADSDRWVVIRIVGDGANRRRHYDYYDADFNLRISRSEPSEYFANQRIWFTQATPDEVYKTPPYMFQHLQSPGQTYSTVLRAGNAVLAVDIALSSLSEYLNDLQLTNDGEIYLFEAGGEVIASSTYVSSELKDISINPIVLNPDQRSYLNSLGRVRFSNETNWPPVDFAVMGEPHGFSVDLIRLLARLLDMEIEFVNGYSWPELVSMFGRQEFEVLQPVLPSEVNRQLGLLTDPLLQLPYAIVTRENTAPIVDLAQLREQTLAIPKGWSSIPILRANYPEVTVLEVDSPRSALQAVANGEAVATLDTEAVLRYAADIYFMEDLQFHSLSDADAVGLPDQLHFLVNPRHSELHSLLNLALRHVTPEQWSILNQTWLQSAGQHSAQPLLNPVVPYRELLDQADAQLTDQINRIDTAECDCYSYVRPLAGHGGDQEYFAIVSPRKQVLASALTEVRYSLLLITLCLIALIPLCWWFAFPIVRPIKRLSEENEKIKNRQYDAVCQYESKIIEVYDLSKSIMEMSSAIKQHEREQQELMDSFIKLIAQAIDDKSPYTGKHCARVPELSVMLATAAERSSEGPFKNFCFASEQERREFSVAAWLHDCGKITTPEHIVDKGTKLETIYNRIHEVRMRFEVLRRDAHIEYLALSARNPSANPQYRGAFQKTCKQLQDDFSFIASINIGSEHLSDQDIARLERIAKTPWRRYFSNRLGLSPVERLRYPNTPEALPALEPLLANRPEHIIERSDQKPYDAALNIRMDIPKYLYNLGELHNLSIRRGTLTPEDRFKINEHMISTVKMLESLSFPSELARVPKYASTHHETLIGTGYPRRLTGADLEIPDRIIAMADIFEALTAADRPYKEAKSIRQAITILHSMVVDGKLCGDTFRLFLTSGVHLQYARQYLSPEQIDEVDIDHYLTDLGNYAQAS